MSETAQATRIGAREGAAARAWVAAHWFPLGVAAITVASAGFLFHQLLAWPPHEDEALPLFVGRHPLGELFQVVLEERGGAPLHFLLAWAVAHLDLGLAGLRAVSAAFAVASLPVVALLAARLAGRVRRRWSRPSIVAASWTFLFHGVYGRMYSLFLLTSALSYLALLRALERGGRAGVGALGARDPGDGGDPSVRRARARLPGRVRRRRPARPAARRRSGRSARSQCSGSRSG